MPQPVEIVTNEGGLGLDPAFLVSFVLVARVDLLCERRWRPGLGWVPLAESERITRQELARRIGWDKGELSTILGRGHDPSRADNQRGSGLIKHAARFRTGWMFSKYSGRSAVGKEVAALESDLRMFALRERDADGDAIAELGGLSAFWQEMVGSAETAFSQTPQEARWFRDLTECGPQTSAEALIAGQALLSLLSSARDRDDAQLLLDLHGEQTTRTVRGLLTVITKPPGRGVLPALNQLALLGSLIVQRDGSEHTIADLVVEHVRDSPVGFRAVRALTRMALLAAGDRGALPSWWSPDGREERQAVWTTLAQVMQLPHRDPYPARSLTVETLRAIRIAGDGMFAEDALSLLDQRARDTSRPTRERVYAAYCVYLALRNSDRGRITRLIESLVTPVGDLGTDDGLRYAARVISLLLSGEPGTTTLASVLLTDIAPLEDDSKLAEFRADMAVMTVDNYLLPHHAVDHRRAEIHEFFEQIPPSVAESTRFLVRYALLSIDGSGRRRAAEALRESGLGAEAAHLVAQVLEDPHAPRWLREQASFLLGFLGHEAGVPALEKVLAQRRQTAAPGEGSVRHAALWALGDIGIPRPQTVAFATRVIADTEEDVRVVRAAVYCLAVLFRHLDADAPVVANTLRVASRHRDELVSELAGWGLLDRHHQNTRRAHRLTDDLWGIAPNLRSTLAGALKVIDGQEALDPEPVAGP